MTITVAATTPVVAAKTVPTKITAKAKPPRRRLKRMPIVSNNSSASPDFSKTEPKKTKKGIASRVKLDIVPNQIFGNNSNRLGLKSPTMIPIKPKTIAVPAKEKATG